jgi:hypothetical protein
MRGLISLVVIFFFSCADKKEAPDEEEIRFRYYNLENQGWKSKKHIQQIDNIDFTATQVPIQYYLLKEMGNEDLIKVDSIYEENKRERVIEFTFEEDNEKDLLLKEFTNLEYRDAVKYMAFTIEKDFYVVTSKKDTIKCNGVQFERNFKVAPSNKLLLFFSDINPDDKIQLVYNDNLFGKGVIKFNFIDPLLNL